MIIKRFILTIALTDAEAGKFTEKLIEEGASHGLDLETGCGPISAQLADERIVECPDPDFGVGAEGPMEWDEWEARAEQEVFGK